MDRPSTLSQVDQAIDATLEVVRIRGLRSGDRLPPERELAAAIGVSRPALREAIHRLVAEGVLDSRHGSGTFVAEVDVPSIAEVRLLLEPYVARRAAQDATPAARAGLRALAARLAATVDDAVAFAEADAELHRRLAALPGNPTLAGVLDRLARLAALSRAQTSQSRAVRAAALADLTALVEAIDARDTRAASGAMRRHLRRLARATAPAAPQRTGAPAGRPLSR